MQMLFVRQEVEFIVIDWTIVLSVFVGLFLYGLFKSILLTIIQVCFPKLWEKMQDYSEKYL